MLQPKKQKFKKAQKGRLKGLSKAGTKLAFGQYGLKALDPERITARQIEAARKTAVRYMKRQGKLWIKIFPDLPITDKPAEVRMGRGKGSVDYYAFRVAPGRIMFEIDGVSRDVAIGALNLISAKLPIRTKITERYN